MISIDEYYENLVQEVLSHSESLNELKSTSFLQIACELLVESGDLTNNYTTAFYKKIGIEVAGYDFDEEKECLNLIVHNYSGTPEIGRTSKQDIETKFQRLENFFSRSLEKLYLSLEETSDEYSLAYHIYTKAINKEYSSIKLIFLSDTLSSINAKDIKFKKEISNFKVDYQIIDLEYLYKIAMPNFIKKDTIIECQIPFLNATLNNENTEYETYLAVLNGEELYKIYEDYGKTLLEENVRTFLQFKGKINIGIRNTIEKNPDLFLAYNNGITATASKIEFNKEKNKIIKIENLQIVNGGQTTSSIYTAKKKYKLDISRVNVQMKLSIVKVNEKYNEFVGNVAKYANSQNKVNDSDLFSNHIFHREFSDYSKTIWAPPVGGGQKRTRWYYERVRGEYLNEQSLMSNANKNKFLIENPKKQKFDKTLLAKSENLWYIHPVEVCKGAQNSFRIFAKKIVEDFDKNDKMITEAYFKNAISRLILFKELERGISNEEWYENGYRAQTVAYTISYLSNFLVENKLYFNFKIIWESQGLYDNLLCEILRLARAVFEQIMSPEKSGQNIGEWCKKNNCWEQIKNMEFELKIPEEYILSEVENKEIKQRDKKEKKDRIKINAQIEIVEIPMEIWKELDKYFKREKSITETQMALLDKMANIGLDGGFYPSDKQAELIYKIYMKAKEEGAI